MGKMTFDEGGKGRFVSNFIPVISVVFETRDVVLDSYIVIGIRYYFIIEWNSKKSPKIYMYSFFFNFNIIYRPGSTKWIYINTAALLACIRSKTKSMM